MTSPPSGRRLAVRVTRDALRQIRGGHPWVYDGSIRSVSHDGASGDLAVVFDDNRKFAAIGLWDPESQIRLRILHHGSPEAIDAEFWRTRLVTAVTRRQTLIDDDATTGYRLVYGESDGLPGLVVDQYGDTLVIKLYSQAWLVHLTPIVAALVEIANAASVVLRLARNVAGDPSNGLVDGQMLHGFAVDDVEFLENNLIATAAPRTGQKTGYFLDQRDNRALVGSHAKGRRVLDVFCASGGFTVHAAAGGAASTHSIDISPHAIKATEAHLHLNSLETPHRGDVGDAFKVMAELARKGEHFDLIVIDPPSFAPSRATIERARNAYKRLTHLGLKLIAPGGLLFQASCSSRVDADMFHADLDATVDDAGRRVQWLTQTGHAIDHPTDFVHGSYLKAGLGVIDP